VKNKRGCRMEEVTYEEYYLILKFLNTLNNNQLDIAKMSIRQITRQRERDEK